MAIAPGLLARGPWTPAQVDVTWRQDPFVPEEGATEASDVALDALRQRGSPSHDGMAGRLVGFHERDGGLELELQPLRWALRLVSGDASGSMAAR